MKQWVQVSLLLMLLPRAWAEPFIEIEVAPQQPYVQQQVTYTMRLYRDSHLQQGDFLRPENSDVLLRPLESSDPRPVLRDGRKMELLEQRWLLFPQRSGSLDLPPAVYSSRFLYVKSEPKILRVRPRPPGSGGFPWLVTPQLELSQRWSREAEKLQAGDQIERTVLIRASQITGAQLPALKLPEVAGFRIHRLPGSRGEALIDGVLWGERVERFLFVAESRSSSSLPPIELSWWNPLLDRRETSRLPGRFYSIVSSAAKTSPSSRNEGGTMSETGEQTAPGEERWLPVCALLLTAGLLGALWLRRNILQRLGCWLIRHYSLWRACREDDPHAAARALEGWIREEQAIRAPPALDSLSADPGIHEALLRLDRALYGVAGRAWQGRHDWRALRKVLAWKITDSAPDSSSPLPPLWVSGR